MTSQISELMSHLSWMITFWERLQVFFLRLKWRIQTFIPPPVESMKTVQTESIKPHCSLRFRPSVSELLQLPAARRLFSLLHLTVCLRLVWSVYFYSVLQLPSVSSAHFSDLELTAACLDIKQIQTLGAVAAAAASERAVPGIIWKITIRALIAAHLKVTLIPKQNSIWISFM